MRNPVRTIKRKYTGTAKEPWDGDLVDATDEWLAVFVRDPPPWKGRPESARHAITFYAVGRPLCVLVSFDERGGVVQYQCDAGLPAVLRGREITFVDLDLDLIADAGLRFYLRDEDDFESRRVAMAYPDEVVALAWEGIDLAERLIAGRRCPFDGTAARLLGMALASEGPL
jgi:protein associated with RNAse G/E